MLVKEVMVKRIYTVNSKDGFRKVLRVLIKNKISGVPVVNSKKRLVGVISEKDLLIHLFPSIKEFYRDIDYYLSLDVIETEAKKNKQTKCKSADDKEGLYRCPRRSRAKSLLDVTDPQCEKAPRGG